MKQIWAELLYVCRTLGRNRAVAGMALLALSLGIGANTAVFSILSGVLLRPLPFVDSSRIVEIGGITLGPRPVALKTLDHLSFFETGETNVLTFGQPERVSTTEISSDLLDLLGIGPMQGRNFRSDEQFTGRPSVAIVSHGFWIAQCRADAAFLGKSIRINGRPFTVVGIMPSGFDFPVNTQVWVPLPPDAQDELFATGIRWSRQLARLHSGFSREQARAELLALAQSRVRRDATLSPAISVTPLHDKLVGETKSTIILLMGAVGLVLLIACANVTNLLMAHSASQSREFAMRVVLGASRFRLIRLLLLKSLVLSLIGGVIGFLISVKTPTIVEKAVPALAPFAHSISMDRNVLLFTILLSGCAGALAGLVPALRLSRTDIQSVIKEPGLNPNPSRCIHWRRSSAFFCVVQIATAVMLLTSAGLMIRSLAHLTSSDPGFRSDGVRVAQISLVEPIYAARTARAVFFENLFNKITHTPPLGDGALASSVPFVGSGGILLPTCSASTSGQGDAVSGLFTAISPGYFRTMGIPLLAGRDFEDNDRFYVRPEDSNLETHPPSQPLATPDPRGSDTTSSFVAIVSDRLARICWPKQSPIGQRFTLLGQPIDVIGVVGEIRSFNLAEQPWPEVYVPILGGISATAFIVDHAKRGPELVDGMLREIVNSVDKDEPLSSISALDDLLARSTGGARLRASLLGVFSGLALLLAVSGVYGTLSFAVTQRAHEVGIRMAVGASRVDILKVVLRQAGYITAFGIVLGLAGSLLVTRAASRFLYGVGAIDPPTFIFVSALLAGTSFVACYIPALRAARSDPLINLRVN
jgi:putative ABC transport system permease protein